MGCASKGRRRDACGGDDAGIAPVSLRRGTEDARLRPVRVLAADTAPGPTRLAGVIDATGVRIGDVDLETAVQLVARLR